MGIFKRISMAAYCILLGILFPCVLLAADYEVKKDTWLRTRSGPGTSYEKQGRIKGGSKLEELDRQGNWSKVRTETGDIVWVHNGFINLLAADETTQEIDISVQLGHTNNQISSMAINEDETLILTTSEDKTAKLWDAENHREIRTFRGHTRDVTSGIFLPNSSKIATVSWDKSIRIWDFETGRQLRKFDESIAPLKVKSNKDGSLVAIRYENETTVIKTGDFKSAITSGKKFVLGDFVKRKGRHFLVGAIGNKVVALEAKKNDKPKLVADHGGKILEVAVSPDEKYIVSRSYEDTRVWDLATGSLLWKVDEHAPVGVDPSVGFFREFVILLDGGWDAGFRKYKTLNGESSGKLASLSTIPLKFLVAEKTDLLYASDAGRLTPNFVTKVSKFAPDASLPDNLINPFPSEVVLQDALDVSADGKNLASAGDDSKAHLWDFTSGQKTYELKQHSKLVDSLKFSSDGTELLTGSWDGSAILWDVNSAKAKRVYRVDSVDDTQGWLESVYFLKDRSKILGSTGIHTFVWDKISAKITSFSNNYPFKDYNITRDIISSIETPESFRIDGSTIWTHQGRGIEEIVRKPKKTRHLGRHDSQIRYFATQFSHHGNYLASFRGGVAVWKVDGSKQKQIFTHYKRGLYYGDVVFRPDDQVLFFGADHDIEIWDWQNNKQLGKLEGHQGIVREIVVHPSQPIIASSSQDGTVRIWNTKTQRELARLIIFKDGSWIAMTPEGYFNASSASATKQINIVRGTKLLPLENFYDALFRPDLVLEAMRGDPQGKVLKAAQKLDLRKLWDTGLPPKISNVASKQGVTVEFEKIDVTFDLTPDTGGLGLIQVKVNGATQAIENLPQESTERSPLSVSQPVFLTPGKNQIEITAFNRANMIASIPIEIEVTSHAVPKEKPNLHILTIGVDKYQDQAIAQLNYAVNDATAIGQALSKAGKDKFDKVHLTEITNEQATKTSLAKAFETVGSRASPEDVFILFLSGHGKTEEGRYYFIPPDFKYEDEQSIAQNGIGQSQWQQWLARIPAQRSVLLYDTCESGSLARDEANKGLEVTAAVKRMTRATGRTILTAATDTEPALEGYGGHGIFSYLVLEAIGVADTDEDGQLEVTEIASHIENELPEISYKAFNHRQIPMSAISGNSFSIGKPTIVIGTQ